MDNATALQEFERHLRRRFPDRSTPVHYVSNVRQFQRFCPKPCAEVIRADVDAFVDAGLVLRLPSSRRPGGWTSSRMLMPV